MTFFSNMGFDFSFLILLVSFLIAASSVLLVSRQKKHSSKQLPPGPPGWPLFGNMFDLGSMPHRTLAELKQVYGPVVWLRIGSVNTLALLNAKAATEFFKNHDVCFADRSVNEVMRSHGFHEGSIALSPYGTYWRVMKRVMTVEMLVQKKINSTMPIRRKCVDDLLSWIARDGGRGGDDNPREIHLGRFVFLASFNMLGNLMLSRDLVDPESSEGSEFFAAIMGLMELAGQPNVVDLFPWLKWVDPQGLRRKMDRELGKALRIVEEFIKERRECGNGKDFLEVLLDFEGNGKDEPAKISDHDLNILIAEIFIAGSETTSATVEWAMVELLSNPKSMMMVKAELAEVIGPGRKCDESDIDNLKYLQAVVKEILRLHPPIPFLVPRKAIQDVSYMGYHIPKGTQILINAWAIGRDPECWDDPYSFQPERFIGSKVDYRGQNFELIPFGAGRRICAGIPLAHRMLHLVLGSLLHEFDWQVENSVSSGLTDTIEKLGVTMRKAQPLKAIPKKCTLYSGRKFA